MNTLGVEKLVVLGAQEAGFGECLLVTEIAALTGLLTALFVLYKHGWSRGEKLGANRVSATILGHILIAYFVFFLIIACSVLLPLTDPLLYFIETETEVISREYELARLRLSFGGEEVFYDLHDKKGNCCYRVEIEGIPMDIPAELLEGGVVEKHGRGKPTLTIFETVGRAKSRVIRWVTFGSIFCVYREAKRYKICVP